MTATASPYWLGLDPGTQSEEVVDTLDELERSVPSGMFESMRVLSRADEPQKLFHHLWTTCEFLARHLCALCNAVYINGNVEDDKLEPQLRRMSAKRLHAFGDYRATLECFAKWLSRSDSADPGPALLRGVLGDVLPASCSEFVAKAPLIKQAIEKMQVPMLRGPLTTALDFTGGRGTPPRTKLTAFLGVVASLRNDFSHGRVTPGESASMATGRGHDSNGEWCHVVNSLLAPAVRDLLTSSSIKTLLLKLQVVELRADWAATQGAEVAVEWTLCRTGPPKAQMEVPTGGDSLTRGSQVVAHVVGSRQRLEFVAAWKHFPCSLRTLDQARREYRLMFADCVYDDGLISEDERDKLDKERSDRDLTDKDVQGEEAAVWATYDRLCQWAERDSAASPAEELLQSLPESLRHMDREALLNRTRHFLEKQEEGVLSALESSDLGMEKTGDMARKLGLPVTVTDRATQRLRAKQKVSKVGSGGGWRLYDATAAVRMQKLLTDFKADLDNDETAAPPKYVWELLTLSVGLVEKAAPAERSNLRGFLENLGNDYGATNGGEEERDAGGRVDGDDDGSAATEKRPSQVSIEIDGEAISARGLTGLIRKLDRHGVFERVRDDLVAKLPRLVGRTRRLASLDGRHEPGKPGDEGTPFGYPVEIDLGDGRSVFFEANFAKQEGVFYLRKLLADCGLEGAAPLPEQEAEESADEGDDATSGDAGAPRRKAVRVTLVSTQESDGEAGEEAHEHPIEAKSVRVLCRQVIRHLLEQRGSALLDRMHQVMLGRTRYLLHTAPIHPSDKEFRAPEAVEFHSGEESGEVYVETHMSRQNALEKLTALCATVDFDCISDDDDDEERGDGEEQADASPTPAQLTVAFRDGTVVDGRTVRGFVTRVLDELVRRDLLEALELPFHLVARSNRATKRHLLSRDGLHSNGREFRNSMEYVWPTGVLQVELNLCREMALDAVKALVRTLEQHDTLSVGVACDETLGAQPDG